jgi:hypothetical protein
LIIFEVINKNKYIQVQTGPQIISKNRAFEAKHSLPNVKLNMRQKAHTHCIISFACSLFGYISIK